MQRKFCIKKSFRSAPSETIYASTKERVLKRNVAWDGRLLAQLSDLFGDIKIYLRASEMGTKVKATPRKRDCRVDANATTATSAWRVGGSLELSGISKHFVNTLQLQLVELFISRESMISMFTLVIAIAQEWLATTSNRRFVNSGALPLSSSCVYVATASSTFVLAPQHVCGMFASNVVGLRGDDSRISADIL